MRHDPRVRVRLSSIALCLAALCVPTGARAGDGPFGIDNRWSYDNSGIWNCSYQFTLERGLIVAEVAGAVYAGGETRLGHTY
jgi:hypothetical protein